MSHLPQHLEPPDTEKVQRWRDRLSTVVEPRILDVVAGLNARGVPTIASCEGHPTESSGLWWPWVHVGEPGRLDGGGHPFDYALQRPLREAAEPLAAAVHDLVRAFWDQLGFPEEAEK